MDCAVKTSFPDSSNYFRSKDEKDLARNKKDEKGTERVVETKLDRNKNLVQKVVIDVLASDRMVQKETMGHQEMATREVKRRQYQRGDDSTVQEHMLLGKTSDAAESQVA